jgi:signal peptidase II
MVAEAISEDTRSSDVSKHGCLKYLFLCLLTIFLTCLDQLSKYLVVNKLDLNKNYPVIKGFLSFEYLENRGVAFGMLSGKMVLINVVVAIVSFFIIYVIFILHRAINNNFQLFAKFTFLQVVCSFLIAGALGNVIDRIRLGYVVDFIKFDFINFPTFNVADCYVTIAALLLFVTIMFFVSEEDLNCIKK